MVAIQAWGRRLLATALAVAIVLGACSREAEPVAADWRVADGATLQADTREIPIDVLEQSCASATTAEGRVEADVDYRTDEVRISVGVRPKGGVQECPGNPSTPYVVRLSEPLGDRKVVGESWPEHRVEPERR